MEPLQTDVAGHAPAENPLMALGVQAHVTFPIFLSLSLLRGPDSISCTHIHPPSPPLSFLLSPTVLSYLCQSPSPLSLSPFRVARGEGCRN